MGKKIDVCIDIHTHTMLCRRRQQLSILVFIKKKIWYHSTLNTIRWIYFGGKFTQQILIIIERQNFFLPVKWKKKTWKNPINYYYYYYYYYYSYSYHHHHFRCCCVESEKILHNWLWKISVDLLLLKKKYHNSTTLDFFLFNIHRRRRQFSPFFSLATFFDWKRRKKTTRKARRTC